MRVLLVAVPFLVTAIAVACTDTDADVDVTGPQPQIVSVAGPLGGAVACQDEADAGSDAGNTGGSCPLAIKVTFRLPQGQFVREALVRFQGDGSDVGIDREVTLPSTYGQDATQVSVVVNAAVPTTILRRGALFTYSVRLVTGTGAQSTATTLTVNVT